MSQDPAFDRFLARCQALTPGNVKLSKDLQLEVSRACVGGWISHKERATVYKDNDIIIVRSLTSKAMLIEQRTSRNVIIALNAQGDVFLYQSEWRDLEDHIRKIAP